MPREMYNEGRIVGYSAYEIYVKQHLSEDPTGPVASEREWLAASIAMGSSMLAKIPAMELNDEDSHGYIDIPLPQNSILASANTIIASFFDGEAEWSEVECTGTSNTSGGCWATRVTDYGQVISNNESRYPSGTIGAEDHDNVPRQDLVDWTQEQKDKLRSYMKIVDGIVIQPGTWSSAHNQPPKQDEKINLRGYSYPTIRLHIKGSIKADAQPYILFTGFTIRSILSGVSGLDGSTYTPSPQNGDFLGPGIFPWANKIIFSVPTSYIVYFASGAYKRELPADNHSDAYPKSGPRRVSDTSVIDMKSGSDLTAVSKLDGSTQAISRIQPNVLENFYSGLSKDGEITEQLSEVTKGYISKLYEGSTASNVVDDYLKPSRVVDDVVDFTTLGDGTAVLTVYQKKSIYPPALYGTFVDSIGTEHLHPIDVVAPGSMKMFHEDDGTLMEDYENTFPGADSINKTEDGELEVLDPDPDAEPGTKVKVAGLSIDSLKIEESSDVIAKPDVADSKSTTGNPTAPGVIDPKKVTIQTGKNKAVTVSLGNSLDGTQVDVSKVPSSGITLDDTNSNDFVTWSALLTALANDQGVDILAERLRSIKNHIIENNPEGPTDTQPRNGPYIEFGPNGTGDDAPIRLYICKYEPETADVPIGSIGIGWGFSVD